MQRLTLEEQIDSMLPLLLSEPFFESEEAVAGFRNMLLANPHQQAPEAFARQLDASGRHNTLDRLPELSMPVQVIGAAHDVLVPVWKSVQIAETIPGAELTVLEGAAHGVQAERAEEFNSLVIDFLAKHTGARAAA